MSLIHWFIEWLCKVTGYIPKSAQDKINHFQEDATKSLEEMQRHVTATTEQLLEATARIEELQYHVEQSKILDMESLQKENLRVMEENEHIRKELAESNEYFKKVESQISGILHKDEVFGFHRSVCIPGASTLTATTVDDTICVAGRTVLEDSITAEMEQEPSIRERYYMAHNYLVKYGLIQKMIEYVASQGGIQYTLGFNENNTATELYYAMEVVSKSSILEFGKKAKEDDTEG